MFETSRPMLWAGHVEIALHRWVLDIRVEASCPEFPWLVDCVSGPPDTADVRVRRVVTGRCHVRPHLPQEVALYRTWEMILRHRFCKRKLGIRFRSEDSRRRHVAGTNSFHYDCCYQQDGDRPEQGSQNLIVDSKKKVVCNVPVVGAQRRFTGLLDSCYHEIIIISPPHTANRVRLQSGRPTLALRYVSNVPHRQSDRVERCQMFSDGWKI